jgi:SAM-dependent methyltransferase
MVALGLIERRGDTYRNSATAAAFLAGTSPADLRPFLRFWDRISYPAWSRLADCLASGPVDELVDLDEDTQRVFSAGVEAIVAGPAAAFAACAALADRTRLLDVGGGTGSWSIAAVRAHPDLTATVVELPAVARIARESVARGGVENRVSVAEADVLADRLPSGHDACLVANLIHYFSPEENRRLLRQIRNAVEPGARLLIADFWTDPTHTEPVIAALMAGEFAVHVRHGDVYSVAEATAWLSESGWLFAGHEPLAGPVSLVSAEAV